MTSLDPATATTPLFDAPPDLPSSVRLTPAELDIIADEVVERIEQRVVDELERRGRRHTPGVF